MAGISYRDASVYRDMTEVHYKDASTWRSLSEVHYNDAGTWRQVFANGSSGSTANLTNHSITGNGDAGAGFSGLATFTLDNDGTDYATGTDGSGGTDSFGPYSGEWRVSGVSADFECRMTMTSGTFAGAATGSWLALTTDRTWTKTQIAAGSTTGIGTLEIRTVADSVVRASCTITLSANA